MKKWLVRIGAYTGYSFLIALALFYLFFLGVIIMIAVYDFMGGV
ncbi:MULTISPECIES: hypothetical protein [Paenibacillus]|nr:hypothetical protein [Paenibacillus cucumis (ex Kampfer et al. 2016)]MDP9699945.1 hypothetical protein [Paenibacillus intestini]